MSQVSTAFPLSFAGSCAASDTGAQEDFLKPLTDRLVPAVPLPPTLTRMVAEYSYPFEPNKGFTFYFKGYYQNRTILVINADECPIEVAKCIRKLCNAPFDTVIIRPFVGKEMTPEEMRGILASRTGTYMLSQVMKDTLQELTWGTVVKNIRVKDCYFSDITAHMEGADWQYPQNLPRHRTAKDVWESFGDLYIHTRYPCSFGYYILGYTIGAGSHTDERDREADKLIEEFQKLQVKQ